MNKEYTYGFDCNFTDLYDFKDKSKCLKYYLMQMLIKTQSIFKYNNLPDTIPQRMLELYLQTNGNCIIAKHNDKLYCFTGGLGGVPDEYYRPTIYTVANPYLNFSKNFEIDKDCVLLTNDSMWLGLLPLCKKYATQLVENDISLVLADINTRLISLISAQDDRTKKSAEKMIEDILQGNLGIIAETAMLDSLKTHNFSNSNNTIINNLIEYHQYIKSTWYNEIGLNANYNMKREALNSGETQLNNDILKPLIDDMLDCRKKAVEKVNNMFDTNITVELNSSWKDNEKEIKLEQENLVDNPDIVEDGGQNDKDEETE